MEACHKPAWRFPRRLGQVSGNFTVADAQHRAVQLRAGALPAKLAVVEERVMPSDR